MVRVFQEKKDRKIFLRMHNVSDGVVISACDPEGIILGHLFKITKAGVAKYRSVPKSTGMDLNIHEAIRTLPDII